MISDDEDFPASYLLNVIGVIALVGLFVAGSYFLLFG